MDPTEENTSTYGEQVNKEKPWLLLNPRDWKSKWWIMANNNYYYENDHNNKNIIAQIIFQDCNMAGEYFRYFAWFKDDDKRYINVSSNDFFDKPLKAMQHNDIVTNIFNGLKYIVNDKFNSKYVKILEVIKE